MNRPYVYTVTWRFRNGATLSQPLALGPLEVLSVEEVARRAAWAFRWSDHTPGDDHFATYATVVTVAGPPSDPHVYTLTDEERERACAPVRS